MENINQFIHGKLRERIENSSLRSLTSRSDLIDFCSNDYLGFARSSRLKGMLLEELANNEHFLIGSTGSRLISGNELFTENLESEIASFHRSESALVFNSGYDANVGLFSSLPQRGDTIILDELVHASIIDGARLSHAARFSFKHNNLSSLEEKLKQARGKIYVGIESIYSMDGDAAPIDEIVELAEKYSAGVIVDEAHAVGIFGKNGRGLVDQQQLNSKVFARVITFGKALGCHGAAVLGSGELRKYLINFARSFIYTTASPHLSHLSVKLAYRLLADFDQTSIQRKIFRFKEGISDLSDFFVPSDSPIQSLLVTGNMHARQLAAAIREKGFDVRAILHPTVPEGRERVRICLHLFNSDEEISALTTSIKQLYETIIYNRNRY